MIADFFADLKKDLNIIDLYEDVYFLSEWQITKTPAERNGLNLVKYKEQELSFTISKVVAHGLDAEILEQETLEDKIKTGKAQAHLRELLSLSFDFKKVKDEEGKSLLSCEIRGFFKNK